ncbi:MAG: UDP-2,3-diacylglucosamine diphosphatase LpxI [Polyangia bacterium]
MSRAARPGPTLGVLAGRGAYPHELAAELGAGGHRVAIAGIRGQAAPPPPGICDSWAEFPLGAIGRVARWFLERGASTAFFAGGVDRATAGRSLRLDRHSARLVLRALLGGDDRLLRAAAESFAALGVEIGDPTPFVGKMLAGAGRLSGPEPDPDSLRDLEVATRAALGIGARDAGQSAIALGGRVAGIEDRRGTDALLESAPGPGAVLAKMVKPGQDRRFDMPAVGPETIRRARAAGVRAIGVEAGGVLLLSKERVLILSARAGISLLGFSPAGDL